MSDCISKQAVNKKLLHQSIFERMTKEIPESRAGLGGYHTGKRDAYLNVIADLVSGKFDTSDQGEAARLRSALEQIKRHEMRHYKYETDIYRMAESALLGDTEPVGDWIDEYCPKCGAQMLGNKIGNEWCSSVVCNYGVPGINTGDG